jgi:hypothetical protein
MTNGLVLAKFSIASTEVSHKSAGKDFRDGAVVPFDQFRFTLALQVVLYAVFALLVAFRFAKLLLFA